MISIVVATHSRAHRLETALAGFARMRPPEGVRCELVVVDNNSADATRSVVLSFARHAALPIRYVFEERQGLSHARNRGVAEAKGDIIAFTDDDCIVDELWLAAIAAEFARDDQLMLLGGRVELFDPRDAPMSIRTSRQRRVLTDDLGAFDVIIGCNFAFRRSAFDRVGGFDPRYGAGSGLLVSNEDTEFTYRVVRSGGGVVYAPDAVVYHDHGRREPAAVAALRDAYASGRGGFYADYILRADWRVAHLACTELCERLAAILSPRTDPAQRAIQLSLLRSLCKGARMMIRHAPRGRGGRPGSPSAARQ